MTGLVILAIILIILSFVLMEGGRRYFESTGFGVIILIACLVVTGGITWWSHSTTYKNDHWMVCHVTDKDRGADNGSYRVYTSNCGQLANQDSLLRGKLNSADLWQKIPKNGDVKLRIAGVRIGLFSHFPNIFDVQEVQVK